MEPFHPQFEFLLLLDFYDSVYSDQKLDFTMPILGHTYARTLISQDSLANYLPVRMYLFLAAVSCPQNSFYTPLSNAAFRWHHSVGGGIAHSGWLRTLASSFAHLRVARHTCVWLLAVAGGFLQLQVALHTFGWLLTLVGGFLQLVASHTCWWLCALAVWLSHTFECFGSFLLTLNACRQYLELKKASLIIKAF